MFLRKREDDSARTVCSVETTYSFALDMPVATVTVHYYTKVENVDAHKDN